MSVSITSTLLKSCSEFLQIRGLFVGCRSWQCQSLCRVQFHSLRRTVSVHCKISLPQAAVARFVCFSADITRIQLPRLSSGVRWFSNDERGSSDDTGQEGVKGYVFHVSNPMAWLKNMWFTYRIQSLVDPLFNLREFQIGAKQALSFLTRLMVMKDFETIKTIASEEVVEKIQQLTELWSLEQQQSIEILVNNMSVTTSAIASLIKHPECYCVSVDFLCIALKRYRSRPLLVHICVRFMREYGRAVAGDWLISDISEFQVRELIASDRRPLK